MKYQWILFDADETLFHFDAYQGLKLMFSRFNVDFSAQDFDHYQLVNKPLWVDYQDGKISAAELQSTRFEMWAEKLGVTANRLNSDFLIAMADICALLPGARELVDALSGKVNMGIITNGFTELQTIRLERTGLKDVFSPLIISEQVGAAKPDVAIFEHAFNLMNNPAKEDILMVGDNLHSDIQGGINAGIDTCWLNIHGAVADENIAPRYQVSSLAELQKLLLA
ncbi:noncanonical pyrimidine nucleotidase, YjjG family [Yersinia rochesterensis]|uniref:Noncanonical pyrimidine nucleotidase, YjjG family n=1 Tax=Yersinia rochesterensis TaxID=1604335 RepID=A0A386HEF1_9GAMM|nr:MULTISPECIES: pyrimidine 5'-nucleotidase [Yersinia]AJI87627.1 HAD hydrolase, IA, variant 1 family protein [Yersinia frederiksenii Y225]CNH35618.1 nucleotidase [Yersinia kristensenii]AIN16889.1 noncanonical pyrimidine nucleotidase, YjjG family [Yersinia rochesterensis]AJJ35491.1 noncanonical pyrimidine nucleotidase, YjjG family [Yersinia rochesterensis]AYD44105.1 dUMP phosphatase [Yersinia rochesterensis]